MCKANQTAEPVTAQVEPFYCFPTAVYSVKAPQFLDAAREVTTEGLNAKKKELKKVNNLYPAVMTDNLYNDPRMLDLTTFIAQTGWSILSGQGYAMQHFVTYLTEFWCQEHQKHSLMEQHVHGYGSQLVGFYFIDVPKDSSRALFHDPKAGKVQVNLPEVNPEQATFASSTINFVPEPGLCMISNAWVPHSFTRHASNKPLRFIHFNIGVREVAAPKACPSHGVEVI
jgi:hypothetical protein